MQKLFFLCLLFGLKSASSWAQVAPDYWKQVSLDEVVLTGAAERTHEPLRYTAFELDYATLEAYLKNAPREFTTAAKQKAFQLSLPMASGKKARFAVAKTRVMDPALEAQHPEIGTYAGVAIDNPGMQVRITVTPGWGFQAMITRADKGVEYVEPIAKPHNQYYMAYDRVDLAPDPIAAQIPTCQEIHPEDGNKADLGEALRRFSPSEPGPADGEKLLAAPVSLKIYRFACSATGEFSQDNGGTKDLVFQKITAVTNLLNAIVERDVNIRLQLIPESYNVIFLDPDTDPFMGSEVGGWMNQNPEVLGQFLGPASMYDIGHVFGRYISGPAIGIANLSSVCSLSKARGCSAGPSTYGDYFLGIAAHEMGHQWSAGHTFNQCNPGDGYSPDSACEPGGGNTILGYNSCGNNNTTGGRDLYYHACTMAEIRKFVEVDGGSTCGTSIPTDNNTPTVSTIYPALTYIPISTPFELTGTGTDPDGHALTYTWDEVDLGPSSPMGTPSFDSPIFRWYEPTTSPTRTFPRIQTIIANAPSNTEVLPSYSRNLTFSFVARDNQLNGGGVSSTLVKLKSTVAAGPFVVNYPNATGVNWKVGEFQTVVWTVANTDKSPVNCKLVNIKLSTDNGLTYPITLAESVPNVGRYCIQVPDNVGTNMRIRVEAADNVFFDISNIKFAISQPVPDMSLCTGTTHDLVCLPADYSMQVSTQGVAGFSDPITLTASGLPNGATATFSPNPVLPGTPSTMTVTFPANATESTFDLTVQGAAGTVTSSSAVTLTVISNNFSAFGLTSPANGAAGVNQQPPLYWNTVPDADSYDVEVATNPSFEPSTLVTSKQNVTVDSFQLPIVLEEGKVYYWRARPKNTCGEGAWSDVRVFVVAVQSCATLEATDVPKVISANGMPTVESKVNVASGGIISDVNVKKIQGNHAFFKDLEVHLIGPTGVDVLLWKDKCPSNVSFNIGMDDGAVASFSCPPPNNGQAYKPAVALSSFNGLNSTGAWTLRVKDNSVSSGGSLSAFELELCSSVALGAPLLVINSPLMVQNSNSATIGESLLKAEDPDNSPSELVFTLMSLPIHGQLQVNGAAATVGGQFTQADINNGALRYYDYGLNLGQDDFDFSVTDGNGGLANGTFVIQPSAVGTQSPAAQLAFALAPNPASSTALLTLGQALTGAAKVSLLNTNGQIVSTWQLPEGANSLRLDLGTLPKGVYAVALEHEQFKFVRKLVLH